MKEGSRSGNPPRGPFGCLILKKKGDELIERKMKRKRKRLILSESEDEDDAFVSPPPPKLICRDSDASVVRNRIVTDSFKHRKEIEIDRMKKATSVMYTGDDRIDRNNKLRELGIERKRSRIDDIGVEERRTEIGKNGVLISKTRVPIGNRTEFETNSSRSIPLNNRGRSDFDRSSNFSVERERESVHMDRQRFEKRKHEDTHPGLLREKFGVHHGGPIRVQGKNGVLKVMPSNKNKVGGSGKIFSPKKEEVENRKGSRSAVYSNGKVSVSPSVYSESKLHVKSHSVVVAEQKQVPSKNNKMGGSEKMFSPKKEEENSKGSRSVDYSNGKVFPSTSLYPESKLSEKSHSVVLKGKKQVNPLKKSAIKHSDVCDRDKITQKSETSLSQESKDLGSCSSKKEISNKKQKTVTSKPGVSARRKEGEIKRGSGTEKQLIREQIRQMLVNAGWTIDLRPRRNRDYQDSVYISPSGTEYWSITKAYYAYQKHFEDEGRDQMHTGDSSAFNPIPEDVLSKLTRKTRKKMEREMKMQQKSDRGSKNAKETSGKKLKNKHVKGKTDGSSSEEDMDSRIMQEDKSLNVRVKGNRGVGLNTDDLAKCKKYILNKTRSGNGGNKKQSGRALLVRTSDKGLNMGGDDFVPYTGKRTVLSWLIDMEVVRLSGKVKYMNKKQTEVMLEGWITREGIHCRCCSKILTISKFELHAGSKLHHPFQNIITENRSSLYQCQLDAWNGQDKSVRLGFHLIDAVGDDPNDDTCGICGDGGDLICCDGCPSTFHQSCLDIQMLPSGDWLCPNCSCKYCGGVNGGTSQKEDTTLSSCSLCEEKYHQLCRQQADATSSESDNVIFSVCGEACEELSQKLQKLLGVKHEQEAGFSWTLMQRSSLDPDTSSRAQCQKAECNSKIAVALTVMDECFLPVVDQRSGVNLIHNVMFNIGSNFNRLNYSGFYTAILERGDEIISAASIRIHGTRLAEMPFIGTRHIYRRQGMCRRLLDAIESALCSLNVEKLVIPAISELMHTWTTVFGFKPLEESHRREVKTLNLLVFPSTDLLQKPLVRHKLDEVDVAENIAVKIIKPDGNNHIIPGMAENICVGSAEPDTAPAKGVGDCKMNDGVSFVGIGTKSPGGSTSDTFDMINNPSDASLKTIHDGPSDCSASDTNTLPQCGVDHDNKFELQTNHGCSSSVDLKLENSTEGSPHEVNVEATVNENGICPFGETSVLHTIGNRSNCPTTVSGNKFQPIDNKNPMPMPAIIGSFVESKLQNTEHHASGVKVEAASIEPDLHPLVEISVQHASDTNRVCSNAVSGDRGTGVNHLRSNSDLNEHNVCKVECKSEIVSSGVKVEAAGIESDLHPLDETSVQHASYTNRVYPNAVSGDSGTGVNFLQSNSDLNEHNVCKVSSDLGICAGEKSDVYDYKLINGVAADETSTSCGSGSSYDTSDMIDNPSDVALADELALGAKLFNPCVIHDAKLDVEAKSFLEPNLQSCIEDDVVEVNEAAAGEDTSTNANHPNAIYGIRFQRTGNLLPTFEESTKGDASEMKTKVSLVASVLYPSVEGHVHNQLQVAALRNSTKGCRESIICQNSKATSQMNGTTSDYKYQDSTMVPHCKFGFWQNVQDGSYSATGGTCKVGNDVAPEKHNSQEIEMDSVDCTSGIAGSSVLLNEVQLPELHGT